VKNNNKLILFDLDGVLFNTKSNMEESWEKVRVNFNIKKKI